jgi:amidase
MRNAGAEVVEVSLPTWARDVGRDWFFTVMNAEFRAQIPTYLATLDKRYPKTFAELLDGALSLTAPRADGVIPNPGRWADYAKPAARAETTEDFQTEAIRAMGLPHIKAVFDGVMTANRLDAMVYPTRGRPMDLVDVPPDPALVGYRGPSLLINMAGIPELVVPAGFGSLGMPITISFVGSAFSEAKLLALGYAFEQQTNAYRLPASTPALPGETIAP